MGSGRDFGDARWYTIRRAQNLKPVSYVCPVCDGQLYAMSDHVLVLPDGDASRRRHAHPECAQRARKEGTLPTLEEWKKTSQPPPSGRVRRLAERYGARRHEPSDR